MLVEWITHYGYIALFGLLMFGIIGVPVPEELLLMYAGYNVSQGHMNIFLTIAVAALGSMCGVTVSYLLGRSLGLAAVHKFGRFLHITDENLRKVHDWFKRWGKWTLTFGYFVPAVRHLSAIIAGTSKLAWHEFAIFAYTGAVIWAITFVTTGYILGPQTMKFAAMLEHYLPLVSIIVIALIVAILLTRYYLNKQRKKL